ncbi:hypothetical protein [Jannaschia seohaensis]|uniref:Roadblock/LC7 domain-containing protein n=1 Tax=Jannaschia seohaensis TaxID=475081 RepID=A0A2Y9B367_9RHOB|nr:hypothetical protein [Jannaschia seohaensis]PWJ12503.1 hypothetical protein BCF38_11661 [Jannaschia seohaensis]SSA50984.1 hypothetical protein SAMN05421539_11661 [Jannaschia seohaensis]
MSADALKALTEAHAACRTVVFADMTTRMVLLSESRTVLHREAQQALALRGGRLLSAMDGDAPDPETAWDIAYSIGPDEIAVFLRVPDAPSDALCCLCAPDIDLDAFATDARSCLNRLAGVEG